MFNLRTYHQLPLNVPTLFFVAIIHAIFALTVAVMLFPSASGLVSLFLVSFGLFSIFERILIDNKESIWDRQEDPRSVNIRTTLQIMALFLGIFVYYFVLVTYWPKDVSLKQLSKQLAGALTTLDAGRFTRIDVILRNNITVLYLFFFLSICYRAGAVFVIAWNASVWGATFGFFTKTWASLSFIDLVTSQLKLALTILPHLVTEASGYILASMSGLFLAKAIAKYPVKSAQFNQVLNACVFLLVVSTGLIVGGAVLEAYYAPKMIDWLFRK